MILVGEYKSFFQVQMYFRCPREILAEAMVEIMQVIKFQTMHATYLVKRFNIMVRHCHYSCS